MSNIQSGLIAKALSCQIGDDFDFRLFSLFDMIRQPRPPGAQPSRERTDGKCKRAIG